MHHKNTQIINNEHNKLIIIAAVNHANTIGINNQLPWYSPEDLNYFRQKTQHHTLIMGRKTFESTGQLPNRKHIIITRTPCLIERNKNIYTAQTIQEANQIAYALTPPEQPIYIIGGQQTYHQYLPHADTLLITKINNHIIGDTFFPHINSKQWEITQQTPLNNPKNPAHPTLTWYTYERKTA